MSRFMTKPAKWPLRPAKTQVSLGIRPFWSEASLCALMIALRTSAFLMWTADSIDCEIGLTPWWWCFFCLTLYVFWDVFVYYPCRCPRNRSPSKIPPLRLPLDRLEGYINSETSRPSWKIKVSITTRLQYDIINGDKHTRTCIYKNPRFLGEFQEIKRLEITEISIDDACETK